MVNTIKFEGIGERMATFYVDETTIAYLKANHLDPVSGKVDINGKNLAVKLTGDNTVGFGAAAEAASTDALFGVIKTYEEDGKAAVQFEGYVEGIATTAAVTLGTKAVAVNNAGLLSEVTGAAGRALVTKAATSSDKTATILLG